MPYSRRDLSLLLPALAAASAAAQKPVLPSKAYRFEDLPVRNAGATTFRAILGDATHTEFGIELHETVLAAGHAPHSPHHHATKKCC